MTKAPRPDSPGLFDLPLDPPSVTEGERTEREARRSRADPPPSSRLTPPPATRPPAKAPAELPLFESLPSTAQPPTAQLPEPKPTTVQQPVREPAIPAATAQLDLDAAFESAEPQAGLDSEAPTFPELGAAPATLVQRLLAGGADLALLAAVLLIVLAGTALAGVSLSTAPRWPLLLFLGVFSFLYCTIPLAFWGGTPGMAWQRLTAYSQDHEPLTFAQTSRRWLGGALTTLLFGLPLLPITWGARALSDLLSDSVTRVRP